MSIRQFLTALAVIALAVTPSAQKKAATPAQEWQTYNHDLAGTRFSPLAEINTTNVAKLAQAWAYKFPPPPGGGAGAIGGIGAFAIGPVGLVFMAICWIAAGTSWLVSWRAKFADSARMALSTA